MKKIVEKELFDHEFIAVEFNITDSDIAMYIHRERNEFYILDFHYELSLKRIHCIVEKIINSDQILQAYKSNMIYISICKVDAMTENDRNTILEIEESNIFCQKLVLTYTSREEEVMLKRFEEMNGIYNLNDWIMDAKLFNTFKEAAKSLKDIDKTECPDIILYSIISKIYIKLPFLTLNEVKVFDKSILEYMEDEFNNLCLNLYQQLQTIGFQQDIGGLDTILEQIELDTTEEKNIVNELKKAGAFYDE